MKIERCENPAQALADYGRVSISFEVASVFDVTPTAGGAPLLTERKLIESYIKDYDSIPGNAPADWPARFDVSRWAVFVAVVEDRRVGGAAVSLKSPTDPAILWDIRVAKEFRGQGVGGALFLAGEEWSIGKGCSELIVETQNINVAACRFYESRGCKLVRIERHAYRLFPDEIQLLWRKPLSTES